MIMKTQFKQVWISRQPSCDRLVLDRDRASGQRTSVATSSVRHRNVVDPLRRIFSPQRFQRTEKVLHRKVGKTVKLAEVINLFELPIGTVFELSQGLPQKEAPSDSGPSGPIGLSDLIINKNVMP